MVLGFRLWLADLALAATNVIASKLPLSFFASSAAFLTASVWKAKSFIFCQ
jgi:hypothetical protein